MTELEKYYNKFNEDKRLLSRHGQVEFIISMKYIHECLVDMENPKILDIGAGTGRYSVALAEEGYDVIELLTKKIESQMKKVKDEKMKIYETFKRMKLDKCGNSLCNNNDIEYNNMSSMKIRKALGFRTHSKKCKKRGRKKGMKHERSCSNSNNNNNTSNIEVIKGIIDTVNESNKDNSNSNNNELRMNSAFKHYGHTETPDAYYGKNCACVFNGINKEEAMPKKLEFSSLNKKPVKIICENTSAESSNCVNGDNKNNNKENENEDNKNTIRKNLEDMFIKTIEQNC